MKRQRGDALPNFQPIRLALPTVETLMPSFTFHTGIGRAQLDDVKTDLVVIPKLASHKVPRDLYLRDDSVIRLIKAGIAQHDFSGACGQKLVIDTPLEDSDGLPQRRVLLLGIGRSDKFCVEAASQAFDTLFEEAIRLGVKSLTVPFVANRATGSNSMTLKGMAFLLKQSLVRRLRAAGGPVALKEIKIFCSHQARANIQRGLDTAIPEQGTATDRPPRDCACE